MGFGFVKQADLLSGYESFAMDQAAAHMIETPQVTGFVHGLGSSMLTLDAMVAEISRTNIPVLILGESGTGKDAYARYIHRVSKGDKGQFWKINCSAVGPDGLLAQIRQTLRSPVSSESSASIFLDNLQELDIACQRALLAELPDSETPGSKNERQLRFLSSGTKSPFPEVEAGHFRRELYFRLNGACLRIPPLRDRVEDIPALADHFLNKYSAVMKKGAPPLTDAAVRALCAYHWPGNIRELENFIRKIVVFGDVHMALNDLHEAGLSTYKPTGAAQASPLKVAARAASKKAERELILQALERTHWNRKRAALDLQISYKSLLYKIKQIGTPSVKQGS
jgi:two-component system, NtrC family, response regulator AtoC